MFGEFGLVNSVMRWRVNIWALWTTVIFIAVIQLWCGRWGRGQLQRISKELACACSNKTLFTKQAEHGICPVGYCLSPRMPLAESSHSLSCYNFHTGFHARACAFVRPATAELPEMFKSQMLDCTLCSSGWWWGSSLWCFIQALQMVLLHSQGEVHWW